MKINILAAAAIAGLVVSCNSNPTKTADVENTDVEKKATDNEMHQCYADTTKDKVFLNLNIKDNNVTGSLDYQIAGKDQNKGSLQGEMKGDTLIADYNFMSEGTQSTRQVIFLKKGNTLVEGYGDVEEKNGKMVFKNTAQVNFGNGIVLQKVECNE
ncbi:MAG: hypothetical protein H0W62_14355 [Chitinophagales bacterium]|nr:hypothetical protein [Chitinophagales bacterium]